VLLLPGEVDEDAVMEAARSLGVRVTGVGRYRLTPTPAPPALLLAFGNLSEHQLIRGVHAIAEAVRRCTVRKRGGARRRVPRPDRRPEALDDRRTNKAEPRCE
jgi:hypothetical protein